MSQPDATNPTIRVIVDFIAGQMDGSTAPPSNSAELQALTAAMSAIYQHDSTMELRELGLSVLRVVILRVRSSLAAEKALRDFIQPGGGRA